MGPGLPLVSDHESSGRSERCLAEFAHPAQESGFPSLGQPSFLFPAIPRE